MALTIRRLARDAREPLHPPDFEPDEPAEGRAGVQVRAAGPFEPAADFGETQRDEQRRKPDREKRHRAPAPDLCRHLGRQQEYCAADHLVDADRGEIPFAELAPQRGPGRYLLTVLGILSGLSEYKLTAARDAQEVR